MTFHSGFLLVLTLGAVLIIWSLQVLLYFPDSLKMCPVGCCCFSLKLCTFSRRRQFRTKLLPCSYQKQKSLFWTEEKITYDLFPLLFFLILELLLFMYWASSNGPLIFLSFLVIHCLFFPLLSGYSLISFSVGSSFCAHPYSLDTCIFMSPRLSSSCQHLTTVSQGTFYGDGIPLGSYEQWAINTEELFCLRNSLHLMTDWLFPLSLFPWRYIHVAVTINSLFLFTA